MTRCAVSTGLPRRDQRARTAAAATDDRPGQGRRNPRAPAPDRRLRTAPARREDPVHPGRPGAARRAAAPATPRRPTPHPAAGPPGNRTALAPQSDRLPARDRLPAQTGRTATNGPVDPPAGAASGPREQLLGIPQDPRRFLVLGIKVAASTVWEILHEA